jgi:hypothetical protein
MMTTHTAVRALPLAVYSSRNVLGFVIFKGAMIAVEADISTSQASYVPGESKQGLMQCGTFSKWSEQVVNCRVWLRSFQM